VPDVVSTEAAGLLVPPKSPEALAKAMWRVLSQPYDPATVLAALRNPDWNESAAMLHESLERALHASVSEAA
jgi:glycosyltransferase involved in cell wall biosynthesis